LNKISGKIINYNESFLGEIIFDNNIKNISKLLDIKDEQYIIPGFIDLHCHGAMGHDTMMGLQSIKKMADYHLSKGSTTLLPTTLTNTYENTEYALKGFNSEFLFNKLSNVMGVHLEGPFINKNKLGAQPSYSQKPNLEFINEIKKIANIKVVTLAPELEGADELINYLVEENINIQIGHSIADYNCCKKIMNKNKIGFTHLYNAMSGNDHRNPGVLSAALEIGEYAEIICDLNHVSESAIKIAKKCIKKLYAVTDAIGATGMANGFYDFVGISIEKKENISVLKNTSTLAGSIMNMHSTFKNLCNINFTLEEAVSMTSYNAAQYINEKKLGIISLEAISNILVLDKELNLKEIYLNGKKIDS